MNWKGWAEGLIAACIQGFASVGSVLIAGYTIGKEPDWRLLATGALIGAIGTGLAYLKQHPLPTTVETTVTSVVATPQPSGAVKEVTTEVKTTEQVTPAVAPLKP
jgi:hypothetical protein